MKSYYTLDELKNIIKLRIEQNLNYEELSEHTGISVRDLKQVFPLLNLYRPCAYCKRPVPLFADARKGYCSSTCYYSKYRGYGRTIEDQNNSFLGRRFSLTNEQITEALERRYGLNEDLAVIAADMHISLTTLSRTLLAVGGKSFAHKRRKECLICSKSFTAGPQAKYCSGRCRTIAHRTGISKQRSNV
jgi:AraC-like DNA-binding protein